MAAGVVRRLNLIVSVADATLNSCCGDCVTASVASRIIADIITSGHNVMLSAVVCLSYVPRDLAGA